MIKTEFSFCSLKNKSDFIFENEVFEGTSLKPTLKANSSSFVTVSISVIIICFFCPDSTVLRVLSEVCLSDYPE